MHCAKAVSGSTDWIALRKLYDALFQLARETRGPKVSRAAAIAHTTGPSAGLDAITDAAVWRFQPAWATKVHLLAEAANAYEKAISLTTDPATGAYLAGRRDR